MAINNDIKSASPTSWQRIGSTPKQDGSKPISKIGGSIGHRGAILPQANPQIDKCRSENIKQVETSSQKNNSHKITHQPINQKSTESSKSVAKEILNIESSWINGDTSSKDAPQISKRIANIAKTPDRPNTPVEQSSLARASEEKKSVSDNLKKSVNTNLLSSNSAIAHEIEKYDIGQELKGKTPEEAGNVVDKYFESTNKGFIALEALDPSVREGAIAQIHKNDSTGSEEIIRHQYKDELKNQSASDIAKNIDVLFKEDPKKAYLMLTAIESRNQLNDVIQELSIIKNSNTFLELTKFAISREVSKAIEPGALLRQAEISPQLMKSVLMNQFGNEIKDNFKNKDHLNFKLTNDKTTGKPNYDKQENEKSLTKNVDKILLKVEKMVTKAPPGDAQKVLKHLHDEVSKKFPDEIGLADKQVASAFFLRCLNPMLTQPPEAWGKPLNEKENINAVQLTKIIQNIGNQVVPTQKEAYLQPLNSYTKNRFKTGENIVKLLISKG